MTTWNREDFQKTLTLILGGHPLDGISYAGYGTVEVSAGVLHRMTGGYPGPDHRMPVCCAVMQDNLGEGDVVISSPPSGTGASLTIRYASRDSR